jgi:hypothetical protein
MTLPAIGVRPSGSTLPKNSSIALFWLASRVAIGTSGSLDTAQVFSSPGRGKITTPALTLLRPTRPPTAVDKVARTISHFEGRSGNSFCGVTSQAALVCPVSGALQFMLPLLSITNKRLAGVSTPSS